jgi:DNA-directed RNA polymerase alpha subunit
LKTKIELPQDLASFGCSAPTIARLKSVGITTVADLISREEAETAKLAIVAQQETRQPPSATGMMVDTLRVNNHILNQLNNANIWTISELLQRTLYDVLRLRNMGYLSLASLLAALIDAGYSEKDGPLLSKRSVLPIFRDTVFYQKLMQLHEGGKLSAQFKSWFNEAMTNLPDEDLAYRPNRKVFPRPFKD